MSDRTLVRLGLTLMIGSVIAGFSVLWWWALFGISEQIGIATVITVTVLGSVGLFTALIGANE